MAEGGKTGQNRLESPVFGITVEELRAETAARMKKSRAKSKASKESLPLRNGRLPKLEIPSDGTIAGETADLLTSVRP
jgi:hypothetical protein